MYSILRVGSQPVSWSEWIVQSSSGLPGQPMLSTGVLTGSSSLSAAPVSLPQALASPDPEDYEGSLPEP